MWEFKHTNTHIEVYFNGVFQFSSDTLGEAYREAREWRGKT
jgi:hypothetical protein